MFSADAALEGMRQHDPQRAFIGENHVVERGIDTMLLPFTTLEEVLLLSEAGKIHLPLPFRDLVVSFAQADNFDVGVNDTQILIEAAALIAIKDPYDRMIVAHARVAGLPLITGDSKIQESNLVRTVWD